ncbi:hypothetical protein C8Q76DRAFT_720319 [Earliella scabrosa]|nr:hypothetical protein C8Q76DRAFT_720319 [Earliella scabrosa]
MAIDMPNTPIPSVLSEQRTSPNFQALSCAAGPCICDTRVQGSKDRGRGRGDVRAYPSLSPSSEPCPSLSPSRWLRTNMDIPTIRRARLSSPPSPLPSSSHQHKPFVFALLIRSLRGRPAVLNVSPLISDRITTMADAESSCTDTSLAHTTSTTTQTSLLDSTSGADPSSDRNAKNDRRASLGLIDAARMRLSMDLHSLLRSNSKSQRIRTVLSTQAEDPDSENPVYPNYAKVTSHVVDLEVRSMDEPVEERTGRGLGARVRAVLDL